MHQGQFYIFDIDGTLANSDHRIHHITQKPKKWDDFFEHELMMKDKAHNAVCNIFWALRESCATGADEDGDFQDIIFITGRPEKTRQTTMDWLGENLRIQDDEMDHAHLFMRPDGDHTDDHIWKPSVIRQIGIENVICMFEDRNRIVDAIRELGIPVMHVAPGDF